MDKRYVCIVGSEALIDAIGDMLKQPDVVLQTFASAQEFLNARATPDPDCLVLDVAVMDQAGASMWARFCQLQIDTPVLLTALHEDGAVCATLPSPSAIETAPRPTCSCQVASCVQDVLSQRDAMRKDHEKLLKVLMRRKRLTNRERQVMDLVVQGRLNKQIAAELGLSHKTIEVHRAHVMDKMECESLAELVRSAVMIEECNGQKQELAGAY